MTEHVKMTIVEGLKKLKLISKRIMRNCEEITKYSSLVSTEKPYFESERDQRKEVEKLLQSNVDLEKEYCRIKRMIDYTNLVTLVTIEDETRTIHEWLCVVRTTGNQMIMTYKALNTNSAQHRMSRIGRAVDADGKGAYTIRLYDENDKRNGQRKWEDLVDGKIIEGRLEVINATTYLLDPPNITE